MGRNMATNNKRVEKTIRNLLQEKTIQQRQEKVMKRLEQSEKSCLKVIENESQCMEKRLKSYGRGITNISSYFNKEVSDVNKNTIWFPLERTATDWEPKPCWMGKAAVNTGRCLHFPCRNFTSYHFMFRDLPQWLLDEAETCVRKSKDSESREALKCGKLENESTGNVNNADIATSKRTPLMRKQDGTDSLTLYQTDSQPTHNLNNITLWDKQTCIKLPPIVFPDGMTPKERKLKVIIEKKRIENEIENKPPDRNINYGKPTSVRRLQRPVRPVVRRMDIR